MIGAGPPTDAAGGIEDRAVARAEPAMVFTLLAERHAARVGAVAVNDEPRGLPSLTRAESGCGSRRLADVHVLGRLDLLRRPVTDEDQLAAPEDLYDLAFGDGSQVDFDGGAGSHSRRIGGQGADEGPYKGCPADDGGCAGGDVEEIAPCRLCDVVVVSATWLSSIDPKTRTARLKCW